MNTTWKFDQEIANVFVDHARQHIPNYDSVIDKSIDVCKHMLHAESKIIDVGCATGNTLNLLAHQGFNNLYGVDSSADMIDKITVPAKIFCSDQFPTEKFDGILCNWTLHFIKDKLSYLQSMYQQLNDHGFLILSEKTANDKLPVHFYHLYKSRAGVSEQDIQKKAESVKNIMYINSPEWYLANLKSVGFDTVYVIDANWCFTTFLCLK